MKDKIIKVLAHNGKISITCANTTNLVEEARRTHDLSPVATAAFGRLLTIASIMGNEMKNQNDKMTNEKSKRQDDYTNKRKWTNWNNVSNSK